jgi:hypothetical protein
MWEPQILHLQAQAWRVLSSGIQRRAVRWKVNRRHLLHASFLLGFLFGHEDLSPPWGPQMQETNWIIAVFPYSRTCPKHRSFFLNSIFSLLICLASLSCLYLHRQIGSCVCTYGLSNRHLWVGLHPLCRMCPALRPGDTSYERVFASLRLLVHVSVWSFDRLLAYWHASSCVVAQVETQP